jgi:hypothetical protein
MKDKWQHFVEVIGKSTAEVLPTVILSLTEMCDGRREQLQKQCAVKLTVMTCKHMQKKTTNFL